jgi:hypothetical protein
MDGAWASWVDASLRELDERHLKRVLRPLVATQSAVEVGPGGGRAPLRAARRCVLLPRCTGEPPRPLPRPRAAPANPVRPSLPAQAGIHPAQLEAWLTGGPAPSAPGTLAGAAAVREDAAAAVEGAAAALARHGSGGGGGAASPSAPAAPIGWDLGGRGPGTADARSRRAQALQHGSGGESGSSSTSGGGAAEPPLRPLRLFGLNDYLGLSTHPDVCRAAAAAALSVRACAEARGLNPSSRRARRPALDPPPSLQRRPLHAPPPPPRPRPAWAPAAARSSRGSPQSTARWSGSWRSSRALRTRCCSRRVGVQRGARRADAGAPVIELSSAAGACRCLNSC